MHVCVVRASSQRDEAKPLGFLHNMIPALRRALPSGLGQPERYSYLVPGQFDSNPCRSACMLNPIYDLLPRMQWITDSNICPRMEDFAYDKVCRTYVCMHMHGACACAHGRRHVRQGVQPQSHQRRSRHHRTYVRMCMYVYMCACMCACPFCQGAAAQCGYSV